TMLDRSSHSSALILSKIRTLYPGQIFQSVIEMDNALKEAQILSMPAIHYSRESVAGAQYIDVAKEILSSREAWSSAIP
ncbi:MAG: hypothetical protein WBY88_03550, partial [Desulfosarcina sp.]